MKEKIKLVIVFILGIMISVVISVYAATVSDAINGVYDNANTLATNVTTLQNDFNTGVIKQVTFSTTIGKAHGSSASITATSQSGYTFVTWSYCHTSGFVASVYCADEANTTCTLFNATYNTNASGTGTVYCGALYRKNF